MNWFPRLLAFVKQLRRGTPAPAANESRAANLFASPYLPGPGWWRDDASEQLRNYQSWVDAAVNAIAQEVARHRPFLYVNTGQAEHEQVPLLHTHPLCRLLDQPNPWLTPWEMWYLTIVYLELTGNCFWYVAPRHVGETKLNTPGEVWIVPTPWVKVIPDARDYVRAYEVAPHYGLSPLQANALTVDAHTELLKSRYQSFVAGPRPGIVLQTEQLLSDVAVRRLEDTIGQKYAGRANWHRPMVLEQGLKASPWTLTPAEMDYINSARMSRDEILALFRVPPPITGIVENVGLGANIWFGARVMFCEGTIQPKLELVGQSLTRNLARRYGADVVVSFPDCSPRNQDQRRLDDELDAKMGLRTYNEIRKSRGLKPIADPRFDSPILPANAG
jgi:phage portal protein BeeE